MYEEIERLQYLDDDDDDDDDDGGGAGPLQYSHLLYC